MNRDVGAAILGARWSDALANAVDAWRTAREPALAELVDVLADLVRGDAVTTRARALRMPPAFDPERHPDNPARWYGFHERIDEITNAPIDPRTGLALAALVGRPPPWLDARAWTNLCDESVGALLVVHADRRAIPVLARATTDPARRARVMPWIDAIERAASAYPRAADRKEIAGWIEAARAARTASREVLGRLLEAIHAEPEDLGAREVYADALLERGDPRGEVMALSLEQGRGVELSVVDQQRLDDLIAEHETEWLGREVVRRTNDRRWRNGMLEEVTLLGEVTLPPTVRIVRRL